MRQTTEGVHRVIQSSGKTYYSILDVWGNCQHLSSFVTVTDSGWGVYSSSSKKMFDATGRSRRSCIHPIVKCGRQLRIYGPCLVL